MSMTTSTCSCTCFLKHSPPPTNPKQVVIPSPRTSESVPSLERRFVVGIACAVIGLQLISSIPGQDLAMATGDRKWSDKRVCPAWKMNSLEAIVPENLPRPSAKRRWEMVGFDSVRIRVLRNSNRCFSM